VYAKVNVLYCNTNTNLTTKLVHDMRH